MGYGPRISEMISKRAQIQCGHQGFYVIWIQFEALWPAMGAPGFGDRHELKGAAIFGPAQNAL